MLPASLAELVYNGCLATGVVFRKEEPVTTLPDKLSDLLELAVRDAQACEAEPDKFTLDMSYWRAGL